MTTPRNPPDPEGLAVAQEIQRKVRPAEIILGGSRAAGDHRPDSDVDLMAVAPDGETAQRTRETVLELFGDTAGKLVVKDMTIIHGQLPGRGLEAGVVTVTREEIPAHGSPGPILRRAVRPTRRDARRQEPRLPAGTGTRSGGETRASRLVAQAGGGPPGHAQPLPEAREPV